MLILAAAETVSQQEAVPSAVPSVSYDTGCFEKVWIDDYQQRSMSEKCTVTSENQDPLLEDSTKTEHGSSGNRSELAMRQTDFSMNRSTAFSFSAPRNHVTVPQEDVTQHVSLKQKLIDSNVTAARFVDTPSRPNRAMIRFPGANSVQKSNSTERSVWKATSPPYDNQRKVVSRKPHSEMYATVPVNCDPNKQLNSRLNIYCMIVNMFINIFSR